MTIDPRKVLRLNLPQWQGGNNPAYRIGAKTLAAIAPEPLGPVETVNVPAATEGERPTEDGIVSKSVLLRQLADARAAIDRHNPEGIVTLGGDCLVDLAPIAYLNERYEDDLAVLWVDAHPDIMGPEQFSNAHAHVLAMLTGIGDPDFVKTVRRPLKASQILYVGLTETTPFETGFIREHGLSHLSPEELKAGNAPILAWLRQVGAKRIAVHFDLDVLDPALYDFLLFHDPSAAPNAFDGVAKGRMRFAEVASILNAVAKEAEIVGLAIAEYMPWSAIELSKSLRTLPLLGDRVGGHQRRIDLIGVKTRKSASPSIALRNQAGQGGVCPLNVTTSRMSVISLLNFSAILGAPTASSNANDQVPTGFFPAKPIATPGLSSAQRVPGPSRVLSTPFTVVKSAPVPAITAPAMSLIVNALTFASKLLPSLRARNNLRWRISRESSMRLAGKSARRIGSSTFIWLPGSSSSGWLRSYQASAK